MVQRVINSNKLYQDILAVTSDYLGPAAQRFIDRQIANHLHKAPNKLTRKDVIKLADWSRVAMALLTDDKKIIDDFMQRLIKLTRED